MEKIIYYFSGTGNSMRASCRIATILTNTSIVSMRSNPSIVSAVDADVIGFVFPVHYWTIPQAVKKFVTELEINKSAYIFAVSTPTLINGYSFEAIAELLQKKGASLAYAKILKSIGNSMSHPTIPFQKFRLAKSEKNLTKIGLNIANHKTAEYPKASAFVRKNFHKHFKALNTLYDADMGFVIMEKCTACGICAKVCPAKNIILENGKPTFKHTCNFCMSCVGYCPTHAINYETNPEMKSKYPFLKDKKWKEKRKRYHNPFISIADISMDKKFIK